MDFRLWAIRVVGAGVVGAASGHPLAPFVVGDEGEGEYEEDDDGEGEMHKDRK